MMSFKLLGLAYQKTLQASKVKLKAHEELTVTKHVFLVK